MRFLLTSISYFATRHLEIFQVFLFGVSTPKIRNGYNAKPEAEATSSM